MSGNDLYNLMADFRFKVMTGRDEGDSEICFSKISGMELTMEQEEIQEGGKNDGPHILMAPHKRHQPLVLERGVLPVSSWMSRLKPGMRLDTWLTVVLLNQYGTMTGRRIQIDDGIVTKWELSGLDAMGNSVLVEKLEIVHDGISYS